MQNIISRVTGMTFSVSKWNLVWVLYLSFKFRIPLSNSFTPVAQELGDIHRSWMSQLYGWHLFRASLKELYIVKLKIFNKIKGTLMSSTDMFIFKETVFLLKWFIKLSAYEFWGGLVSVSVYFISLRTWDLFVVALDGEHTWIQWDNLRNDCPQIIWKAQEGQQSRKSKLRKIRHKRHTFHRLPSLLRRLKVRSCLYLRNNGRHLWSDLSKCLGRADTSRNI